VAIYSRNLTFFGPGKNVGCGMRDREVRSRVTASASVQDLMFNPTV
jgi:hypothetical protein